MSLREVTPLRVDLDLPRAPHKERRRDVTTRTSIFSLTLLTEVGPEGVKFLLVDDLCTFTVSAEVACAAEVAMAPTFAALVAVANERMGFLYGPLMDVGALRAMERPAISGPISATVDGRTVVIHFDADMGAALSEVQAVNLSLFIRDMALSGATGDHELVGFDDLDHPIVMSVEPVGPRDLDGFTL